MEIKVKLLVEKTHQGTEQQVYHETKEYRSLVERTATPGGERLGEQTFCKTMGVAVHSTSDIYSLGETTEFCG